MKRLAVSLLVSFFFVKSYSQNVFPSSGNVGIGNATPSVSLHVGAGNSLNIGDGAGTSTAPQILNSQPSGVASIVTAVNDGTNNRRIGLFVDQANGTVGLSTSFSSGNPAFVYRTGGVGELFRISGNGNIGIGTNSPAYQITTAGAVGRVASFATDAEATDKAYVAMGGLRAFFGYNGTTSNTVIQGIGSKGIEFNVNNNTFGSGQAMVISPNGNIGIGTTTPTVHAGYSGISTNNASNGGFIDFLKGGVLKGYICGDDGGLNLYAPTGLPVRMWANGGEKLTILANGNVGIGTSVPDEMLSVVGTVHAKAVKVNLTNLPDYVFDKDYKPMPLGDVKIFIDVNHHLPEVSSAKDVEKNGLDLGEMNKILLKKVEELTLYLIEQNEQLLEQKQLLKRQQLAIDKLKAQITNAGQNSR